MQWQWHHAGGAHKQTKGRVENEARAAMRAARLQQAAGGAPGLPRVLRARWMPTIRTWMDMGPLSGLPASLAS